MCSYIYDQIYAIRTCERFHALRTISFVGSTKVIDKFLAYTTMMNRPPGLCFCFRSRFMTVSRDYYSTCCEYSLVLLFCYFQYVTVSTVLSYCIIHFVLVSNVHDFALVWIRLQLPFCGPSTERVQIFLKSSCITDTWSKPNLGPKTKEQIQA